MPRGRGIALVVAATTAVVVFFAALGVIMVAWATEDTTPQALVSRQSHDERAVTTTRPAPTTTVTTAAPAPEPPPTLEPEPLPPPAVQVAGVTATRPLPPPDLPPDPEPAPEPDPAPLPAVLPPAPPPDPPPCPGPGSLLDSHNSIRCQNGLNQLGLDGAMSAHAQFHAERLMNAGACNNLFHSTELASWYGGTWGENVACIFSTTGCSTNVGAVMNIWMSSPEHRANILDPSYSWMGTGYACDGQHAYFVVQFRG